MLNPEHRVVVLARRGRGELFGASINCKCFASVNVSVFFLFFFSPPLAVPQLVITLRGEAHSLKVNVPLFNWSDFYP